MTQRRSPRAAFSFHVTFFRFTRLRENPFRAPLATAPIVRACRGTIRSCAAQNSRRHTREIFSRAPEESLARSEFSAYGAPTLHRTPRFDSSNRAA